MRLNRCRGRSGRNSTLRSERALRSSSAKRGTASIWLNWTRTSIGCARRLERLCRRASFSEGKDYNTLKKLLGQDLPFVYFFCHGQTVNVADRNTWLSVGNEQKITADEFIGWTQTWSDEGKRVWDKIRPLVFMNACHSLEIASSTLVSYLDAFVGNASAAGVIGTEVKVEQKQAMELAEQFFAAWLNGATVESALREIRMDFLRKGNLFGLVYTPYCWSELKVVKQSGG